MSNISDIIEKYLIALFEEGNNVNISRNELANYFSCAPSQINYVLTTRFTPARGFVVESRRGGGGYISLVRLEDNRDDLLNDILNQPICDGLSYPKVVQMIGRMYEDKLITKREAQLIASVTSDKALIAPSVAKDGLRAGIMKSVATTLLKSQEGVKND